MIKKLRRTGDGNALILDPAILELVGLEHEGEVQLTIHNGSLIITPANPSRLTNNNLKNLLTAS